MNYFSSDYVYVIKSSFENNWWLTLLYFLPSLFFAFLIIFTIYILYQLNKEASSRKYKQASFRAAQGGLAATFVLFCSLPFLCFFLFLSLPEMGFIEFNIKQSNRINHILFQNKLSEYKENPAIVSKNLQFGSNPILKLFNTEKYNELSDAIHNKVPDAYFDIIYDRSVYLPLNQMFIDCFSSKVGLENKSFTMNDIKENIILNEEICLGFATDQFIKELNN